MTVRRVQGFNVPYTYPDHNDLSQKKSETAPAKSQETVEKSPENPQKQTSQIGELKQEGVARSLELNSQFPNQVKQSAVFKGDIVTVEPYVKDPKTETSGFALPEVDDELL